MKKIFNWDLFLKAVYSKGLNTRKFHEASGISLGTISSWKTVKEIKNLDRRATIERILGVKYEDLCIVEGEQKTTLHSTDLRPDEPSASTVWPVIGRAAGGPWIEAIENSEYTSFAEDYMPVSLTYKDPNGYALRVVGDSMEPVLPEGTQIAVSPNRPAQNGDKAVVFVRSEISNQAEVCVKRFFYHGPNNEQVRLESYNPAYKDIILPVERILKAHKVIEWHGID